MVANVRGSIDGQNLVLVSDMNKDGQAKNRIGSIMEENLAQDLKTMSDLGHTLTPDKEEEIVVKTQRNQA